ncbi:MAG: hypothetical protein ACXVCK_09200, partial [Bdellovibrionota bacterium]
ETRTWKEITGFRYFKAMTSETVFFQTRTKQNNFLRFALFGAPKFDLPLSCVKGGKEGFLSMLSSFPDASHLVPERATLDDVRQAA